MIQCLSNRDYSQYKCRSCAIKAKWTDDSYRANRPKPKPSTRAKSGSIEHRQKLSDSQKGKTLSNTTRHKLSLSSKRLWESEEYRNKWTESNSAPEVKAKRSLNGKKIWTEEFKSKYRTQEFRHKLSEISKTLWKSDQYRRKMLKSKNTKEHKELMRQIQKSPEYISKLSSAYLKMPRVSSLQLTLYGILDDLNVNYFREDRDPDKCLIGPWAFDCVVPTKDKTLLIECQGDWIHSLPHKVKADKAKSSYVERYFPDHELRYIWEHQFSSYKCVSNLLKHWLNIEEYDRIDFEFKEVVIKECKAVDYKPLLQSYHYLSNAGRGGQAFGAFLNDRLIAVCIFSPLSRQNITIQGFGSSQVKELSRFCIHPSYQKKNLGSWMINKCIKMLSKNIKAVVSYADGSFNHDGVVYKAANFKFAGFTKGEYWYSTGEGWIMHKKTLYNKARNFKMTEADYAQQKGYYKVKGRPKSRYVYLTN
jgi:GNAT superfamily N-acetyltransferase